MFHREAAHREPVHEPDQKGRREPKIHVTREGHRYVDPDEMFDDPSVRERLKQANVVAARLGIKGSG